MWIMALTAGAGLSVEPLRHERSLRADGASALRERNDELIAVVTAEGKFSRTSSFARLEAVVLFSSVQITTPAPVWAVGAWGGSGRHQPWREIGGADSYRRPARPPSYAPTVRPPLAKLGSALRLHKHW